MPGVSEAKRPGISFGSPHSRAPPRGLVTLEQVSKLAQAKW